MLCYATIICHVGLRYYNMLRYVTVHHVMLRYATLCYAMLCFALLCYAMLRYVMLCYVVCCCVFCSVLLCFVIVLFDDLQIRADFMYLFIVEGTFSLGLAEHQGERSLNKQKQMKNEP